MGRKKMNHGSSRTGKPTSVLRSPPAALPSSGGPGPLAQLPNEVMELALSYCDWGEWCGMGATCKRFREVASSDRLWARDYARMRHCIGCPEVSEGFRSVYMEGGFRGAQQEDGAGVGERVRRTYASARALFGKDMLRLVATRHPHMSKRPILAHSPDVDLFFHGTNRVMPKFARCPRRVQRSAGEASGMIVTLQTSHPTLLALDLDHVESIWSERTSEIPILAFLPSDDNGAYWGPDGPPNSHSNTDSDSDEPCSPQLPKGEEVSKRMAIDALKERLPSATFRVQPCSYKEGRGVGEGMQWLVGAAKQERQQRELGGVEPLPNKHAGRKGRVAAA